MSVLITSPTLVLRNTGPHQYLLNSLPFDTRGDGQHAKVLVFMEMLLGTGTFGADWSDEHRRELGRYLRGGGGGGPVGDNHSVSIRVAPTPVDLFYAPPGPEAIAVAVLTNTSYRRVLYTSKARAHQQVAMSVEFFIPPEIHPDTDQYFLVKKGRGRAIVDGVTHALSPLSAFWVERGQRHEIHADLGAGPLKLFVSYAAAHHPPGRHDEQNVDIAEWLESDDFAVPVR